MRNRFEIKRRQFLEQFFQTLALLNTANVALGSKAARAVEQVEALRPNLINIHFRGGWDSCWFQSPYRLSDRGWLDYKAANPGRNLSSDVTERHSESQLIDYQGHLIGFGLKQIFSDSDLQKILIWKGIASGGHDDGNRVFHCGQLSPYAASFCSVIAAGLAKKSAPLPLQYVQLSNTPEELYSPVGLMSGSAIPLNLPSLESFRALTVLNPVELDETRRGFVNDAIDSLTRSVSSSMFKFNKSKMVFENFLGAYSGLMKVYGGGLADSDEFKQILARYRSAIRILMIEHFVPNLKRLDIYPNFPGLYPAFFTNLDSFVQRNIQTQVILDLYVFRYALSEFLLKKQLSRVINFSYGFTFPPDIMPLNVGGDFHANNESDLMLTAMNFGLFRELMRGLAAAPAPGSNGKSLLDMTTLVLATEMDRTATVFPGNPTLAHVPGSNHGASASILMAGYGVNSGKVIGDFKMAPFGYGSSKYGDVFKSLVFEGSGGPGIPLPIDFNTGQPDINGKFVEMGNIFPTLVSIFDVPIPSNQITDHPVVPAAIKKVA